MKVSFFLFYFDVLTYLMSSHISIIILFNYTLTRFAIKTIYFTNKDQSSTPKNNGTLKNNNNGTIKLTDNIQVRFVLKRQTDNSQIVDQKNDKIIQNIDS